MRNEKLVAFGQRVREIRKAKGLTQENMAALAEIDRSYMGHIERGEKNITLTKIYQISEALGIDVTDLFPRSTMTNNSAPKKD
ncbi:helix-turn-helix transcriptional regulator [Halomonas vilamensis]|uniref:Helix-turn-helix transcriptional regulator n=1 Tax=Vreelandella vilamensis TaxID=531309 RepID=A0ABU1H3H8_9GAMM|nr:helix-turn-helix transcriptional regulator [Halomonas vilamensis]MDR5898856.1 helix-turn-helix transcriptional regulator [Halomonas vilamensis]